MKVVKGRKIFYDPEQHTREPEEDIPVPLVSHSILYSGGLGSSISFQSSGWAKLIVIANNLFLLLLWPE